MSITEHVTVFLSIIIGIAIGDLLFSLHKLLRARARVRWHWLPLLVALNMLLLTVSYWWMAFNWYQTSQGLTVADFLPTLTQFVVLFLLVAASLPDDVPPEGINLCEWYFANSKIYWTMAIVSLILDTVVGGVHSLGPGDGIVDWLSLKANNLILLPFTIAMIVYRKMWYHGAYVILTLTNMLWLAIVVEVAA